MEESRVIIVNGVEVTCFEDGSVEKVDGRSGKRVRTFGSVNGRGYMVYGVGYQTKMVSHLIAEAFLDDYDDSLNIDHIDGDGKNNRPSNLRSLTTSQNLRAFQRRRGGTSRFRGVHWSRVREMWCAQIRIKGIKTTVGHYDDELTAVKEWDKAAMLNGYQEEALNFPKLT